MADQRAGPLRWLNQLRYTSDMMGGQAIAQTRNLWLFFGLGPSASANVPAVAPDRGLGFIQVGPEFWLVPS